VELGAVGDAHEVAVPHTLKVQAPEPDFKSGWEGVRAAHGVPLGPVLGADYHRDGWWKADLQRAVPYPTLQLSVRKVVPTLTSKSVEIYLSMAGAKKLVTQILSWFRLGSYVQQLMATCVKVLSNHISVCVVYWPCLDTLAGLELELVSSSSLKLTLALEVFG
jgi:hypothetical protein